MPINEFDNTHIFNFGAKINNSPSPLPLTLPKKILVQRTKNKTFFRSLGFLHNFTDLISCNSFIVNPQHERKSGIFSF